MNGESHFAWACAYVESNQAVPNATPIPETRLSVLEGVVTTLVQIEGPIHKDEIARRITSLWGLQRTGARIAEAISRQSKPESARESCVPNWSSSLIGSSRSSRCGTDPR